MKVWLLFPLLVVSKGRKCEFLARPSQALKVRGAGNVSGTVQHCAHTNCCMGFFKLVNEQPRPDLLGCDMMKLQCPEQSCFASKHLENYISCVCGSDLCNANITWKPEMEGSQHLTSLSDPRSLGMAAIPLGTLLLVVVLYVAAQRKRVVKNSKKKPFSSLEGSVTSLCSCSRTEMSDLNLTAMEIQQLLCRGHFASVWQGCLDGALVAVKAFPAVHIQKFTHEREVFGLPLMEHPNLVQFLGAGRDLRGGERVLVLELAERGSLKTFLSVQTLDWRSSLKLAWTLSQGLAFLHSDLYRNGVHKPPVTHGDLSSGNVLVRSDGSCALCDFGCSTVLRSCPGQPTWQQPRAQPRAQVGTLRYMSPEILEGCVNLHSGRGLIQGDVYSLGLLLWELWTRCSDLYGGDPVPEHHLPYEAELGPCPSLSDLLLFVSEKRARPLVPKQWNKFSQVFSDMKETLEDCWDHDPEARLTAQCAADRLAALSLHCLQ